MRVTIRVLPGSARQQVGGSHEGALVVRVSAPAADGRATAAALAAVAAAFGVRRHAVRLVTWTTSRTKVIEVDGADQARLDQLLTGERCGMGVSPQDGTTELRGAVAAFDAVTPREHRSRARFLAELDRLPDPFNRDADPVHVTGSAVVVGPRGTVLHWHKRLGGWMQPGGHIDPGETPWEAALREAHEETGLPVRHPDGGPRLVHLDVHPAGPHVHLDTRYLLLGADAEPLPPAEESQQVRWFSFADAIAVADAALVDGLRRVAARQSGASPYR